MSISISEIWRLKESRKDIIATRCPETGAVVTNRQNGFKTENLEFYIFDKPELKSVVQAYITMSEKK